LFRGHANDSTTSGVFRANHFLSFSNHEISMQWHGDRLPAEFQQDKTGGDCSSPALL